MLEQDEEDDGSLFLEEEEIFVDKSWNEPQIMLKFCDKNMPFFKNNSIDELKNIFLKYDNQTQELFTGLVQVDFFYSNYFFVFLSSFFFFFFLF